jgi:hypothetical protein
LNPRVPLQLKNLLNEVKECIETENYRFSKHAIQRGKERLISYQDTLYVLANGIHEEKKTSFDFVHGTWKYAIRGRTADGIATRVIIAFEEGMVIITVISLIAAKKKVMKRSPTTKRRRS